MKMNERQRRFADEYIRTGNIFQSAINAGYSDSYARMSSYKLLEHTGIKAYISKRLAKQDEKDLMSQREALSLLTQIGRGEMMETITIFTGEGVQETEQIPTQPDTRLKAIESILKRYDGADMDALKKEKLKLENEKLAKELEDSGTTEDKMDDFLNKLNETIGTEGS